MTRALIFAIFALSLDVLWGYTGLFSLGQAAFFGVGGYTAGILIVRYGVSDFWIGAASGIVAAAIVGATFGLIALRTKGAQFLLVTFALGQLLQSLAISWGFLSNSAGTEGVIGIIRPSLHLPVNVVLTDSNFYYLVYLVFISCFVLLSIFVRTPVGYALRGVRDSESRMRALGYDTWNYKFIAFIISAAFAGTAGVLVAYNDGIIVPDTFGVGTSTLVLLMVLIGGAGTLYGPVIGALSITLGENYASTYLPERWPLILGSAFVVAVMVVRGGLAVRLTQANAWFPRIPSSPQSKR